MPDWIPALPAADLPPDSIKPFAHNGKIYVLCRTPTGTLHALDGICTHAQVQLSYGSLVGNNIQCPQHGGRFDLASGKCRGGPVTVGLKTYPIREEAGEIQIQL